MKCLFLYNPNSGKGRVAKKLAYIRRRLGTVYDEVEIAATASGKDLEERVRAGVGKYDAIVFSGGDGTFNNVLQGVGEADVRLGYLPTGTANDVARSLRIPRRIGGALNVILKGRCEALDCMRINGERYAMYIAAAGTITTLTYETPQRDKRALGWFAYAFHGIKHNLRFAVYPFRIRIGETEHESDGVLALVMNGRSVAGFPVNRKGSMQDGVLEVAVIRQAKKPNFFQKLGAYLSVAALMIFGVKVKKKDIAVFRGSRIGIGTDDAVIWDFDGEEGIRGSVDIEVLPRRVHLFVPKRGRI